MSMPAPWMYALEGGILIGISATIMLWLNGRVAGISGIFFDSISGSEENSGWRWAFLFGLLTGGFFASWMLGIPITLPTNSPDWTVLVAGLLVGFGVRLGTGCTSGHGVCGVGRLAPRSLLATASFLMAGILSVYLFRSAGATS